MDDKYSMKKPPSRLGAWVILIFASIAALVDAMVWLPFYRVCQANGHNVLAAIKTNTKAFALFAGLAAVFFVFWIIANIKFSKAKRFRGGSFGGFLGRLVILAELAAYVLAVVLLFVAI